MKKKNIFEIIAGASALLCFPIGLYMVWGDVYLGIKMALSNFILYIFCKCMSIL